MMTREVLDKPTLVLNKSWLPISVSSVKRALKSVYNERANFLCQNSYCTYDFDTWRELEVDDVNHDFISHNGINMRIPEIIVLTHYNKVPRRTVKLTRRNLLIRDNFICQYTGNKIYLTPPKNKKGMEATIDHITPQCRGGKTTWDNVVMCSFEANTKKGRKSLKDSGMKLLKKPKEPIWSPIYSRITKTIVSAEYPISWSKFLNIDPELYWDVELQK